MAMVEADPLLKNVPPHSIDAERAVLGALLIDPSAIDEVATLVMPDQLYRPAHIIIYQTIIDLWRADKPVDVVLLNEELSKRGTLEQIGGTAALAELTEAVPTAANAPYYAKIVRDHASRRDLIRVTAEVQRDAFDTSTPNEELLDRTEKKLFEVTQQRIRSEAVPVATVVEEAFKRLKAIKDGQGVTGLPTGFVDVDELTQGFQPGEMTILAARPSMGKCVAWDTELLLADGSVVTIEEVHRRKSARLLTLGDDQRLRLTSPSAYVDDGVKPVFRVTTRLGRVVETTASHPFLTPQGWRPLAELTTGAVIGVPRELRVFGDLSWRPSEVKALAYAVGAGGAAGLAALVEEAPADVATDIREALATLSRERGAGRDRQSGSWATLERWLEQVGAGRRGAIPPTTFRLERPQLALFLGRLFAISGSVELHPDAAHISYVVPGDRVARQVQHLLLRFGVVAHVGRGEDGRWYVDVRDVEALRRFADEVGLFGAGHLEALLRQTIETSTRPAMIGARAPLSASGPPVRVSRRAADPEPTGERAGGADPEVPPARGDVLFDEVVSIEPSGLKQVYDLTVPGTHNFVAADVCVHNTSLCLNILRNVTVYQGKPAVFFSLEMPRLQVTSNILCSLAKIDGHRLRGGYLTREEERNFLDAAEVLAPAPLFIDDTPGLSTMELRAKVRRLKSQHDIAFVVIDYLQLMSGSDRSSQESRQQEVSEISRMIKALSRELSIPIMALAQLSRKVEERKDHKPMMSDLRESGCLAGDTLVTLADTGQRVPIRELEGKSGFDVWALNTGSLRLERAAVSAAFCTGTKPVFKLSTALGRTIRATANHRFYTVDGWKRLDELSTDDRLALPRALAPGAARTISDAELGLLGHLIGDGCTLDRRTIQYTTKDEDLAELVMQLATERFGADVRPHMKRERSWMQVYLPTTRAITHGVRNPVCEWLDRLGLFGLRSWQKFVPEVVFAQPADAVGCFLRHLWATDGCIHVGASPHPAIYYASSSERLARDVQSLLLRLEINATLRRVPQKNGRDQYHVVVSGRSDQLRFAKVISAVGARKLRMLEALVARHCDRIENTNRDVVPAAVWSQHVRPAMRERGLTDRNFQAALGMSYCGSSLYRQNMGRERAGRVAAVLDSPAVTALATSDLYWDRIVAIEADGEERVFDLTVPDLHSFVANDIVVHNSIEQDADVIMLLFRPEYYEPDKEELKNKAEVIVAKNRNGPVGEVKMAFFNSHMRFESLTRM